MKFNIASLRYFLPWRPRGAGEGAGPGAGVVEGGCAGGKVLLFSTFHGFVYSRVFILPVPGFRPTVTVSLKFE